MEHAFDPYHKALLQALRRHQRKFRRVSAQPLVRGPPGALLDRRQFFELRLRNVLERNIDDVDIQSLSFQKLQDLRHKLDNLFSLLNGIANQNLGTITCDPASQCICKPGGHHLRLENLLSVLFHSDGPFDLSGGSDSAIFMITELQCGKRAASLVGDVKNILDSIHLRIPKKRPADEQSSCTNNVDNWLSFFGHEYRHFIGKILDTIRTELKVCDDLSGCDTPHKVLIRLLDLVLPSPSSSEAMLDIFLFCPRPTTKTWQNTRCKIDREIDVGSDQTKKLCEYLEDSVRFREGLMLLFDETLAAYTQGFDTFDLPIKDPTTHPFQSLNDLLELFSLPSAGSSKPALLFKHPERRALAAKLALHFLICCSWENMPEPWDSSAIYFLGSSTQDFKRDSPYISCLEGNEATDTSQEANDNRPIQCFTALAKLLLEIEYGPIHNENYSAAGGCEWTAIRDYHRKWLEMGDLSRQRYLNAVDACLQFHRRYRRDRLSSIGKLEKPGETRQRLVRTDVVRNLVADLPGFQQPVTKRPKTVSSFAQNSQVFDPGFGSDSDVYDERFSRSVRESNSPEWKETHSMEIRTRAPPRRKGAQKVSFAASPHINAGSLFDFESDPQRPTTASSAEKWFRKLNDEVGHFIIPCRKSNDKRIKVAVLDTGIDIGHPEIQKKLSRNKSQIDPSNCKDWTASPHAIGDKVGHGTAVCDILLRVAKVDLFVGKISDSANFDGATPAIVAEAIKHAASPEPDGWNVDIIVLSLGFEDENEDIRTAIRDVHDNKIILAAASNSGSINPDRTVAYPARILGQVISIRSADGYGGRAAASPKPSSGDDSFMVLGEGIEAAWSQISDVRHSTRYVSGSSFATPVAAGIVALVLEFSQQKPKRDPNVPEKATHILKSFRGTRKIFEYMSTADADGRMIHPWKLFNPKRPYELIASDIKTIMESL